MISSNKNFEYRTKTINVWENILISGKYNLFEPDPIVINRIRKFQEKSNGAFLDLGCGFGRHLKLLTQEKYTSIGLDCAFTAIKETKKNTQPPVQGLQASMTNIPLRDETIGTLLAWRTIYFLQNELINRTIDEIYRVLKREGHLICSVRSTENTLYHVGREIAEEIEPNTFRFPEHEYDGAVYHFFSKEEILKKFSNFEIHDLKKQELKHTAFTENHPEYKNEFLVFWAVKR